MTTDERIAALASKLDEVREDVSYLRGRFDTSFHTPLDCPLRKDIEDLKGFKSRLLGMAALASFVVGVAVQFVKGLFVKGGQ